MLMHQFILYGSGEQDVKTHFVFFFWLKNCSTASAADTFSVNINVLVSNWYVDHLWYQNQQHWNIISAILAIQEQYYGVRIMSSI